MDFVVNSPETKEETVKLNHLADLRLLAIFTRLPQADLITVGRVCTRWKSLVLEVNNKITSLTISIYDYENDTESYGIWTPFVYPHTELLLQNDDDKPTQYLTYDKNSYTKWNSLVFTCAQFNLSLVKLITNAFPAITSLELSYSGLSSSSKSIKTISHLLAHYHSQLISIKLICESKGKRQLDCSALFRSIYQMPSPLRTLLVELRSPYKLELDYYVELDYYCVIKCLKNPLPIISQLEKLYLNEKTFNKEQMTSIKKAILANTNLRQVGLHFNTPFEPTILPFEKELGTRVTYLVEHHLRHQYRGSATLPMFCNHFPSLTSVNVQLNIIVGTFEYLNILKQLSTLRQLIHLKYRIIFCEQSRQEEEKEEDEKWNELVQIPSVKIIQFDLFDEISVSNFAKLDISHHFPRVEVIEFKFCGQSYFKMPSEADEAAIYDSLKQSCPRLHHIYKLNEGWELVLC